ncbi:leucine-rich repeat domain-containing protein, partial [Bacillus pacificus]
MDNTTGLIILILIILLQLKERELKVQRMWIAPVLIAYLTELKKVEELYLRETKLSDYSPLNEMKSITRLDLIGNNIEDIRPICTLT